MKVKASFANIGVPNYRAALDAPTALCLYIAGKRRGASERGR